MRVEDRFRWGALALLAVLVLAAPAHAARIVLPSDVTPDHYEIAVTPDAQALTFTGHVKIDLTVHAATRRIVLNDADIVIDKASLSGEAAAPRVAPEIAYDEKTETASFAFARTLAPGRYALSLDYHGKIYQQASGLFALDYKTQAGSRRALFTQFENSDARRFVPCWDEPGRKATFSLTVTAPADEMALSNMPVAETTPLAGGLARTRFAETPKMSSYLLFFGLGDFERVHRDVGGVDVGVVVKRGDTARAQYALDAAAHILPYYNSYFAKPYPLPKLDLIAGPGSSQFFGAMENWGAIFFFERDLLVDPRVSTESDKQGVYTTVAHEMAHQWFGDLVTMAWWDDLWLNEGFASWMENKSTDQFHPEWKLWLQELGEKEGAMQVDARAGTHPIITPIDDVLQANEAFDTITYSKGAAVIRMFEAYVGPDDFRAGVRRYIAAHAYGNTVTDDLWRQIDPVSPGKPLTGIAHDFTLQAGVPLIREVSSICEKGNTSLTMAEGRFAVDAPKGEAAHWRVPVTAAVLGGGQAKTVVGGAGARVSIPGCGPVVLNAGQAGYFRSVYTPEGLAALTGRFGQLTADDQLGLINDERALAYVGDEPMGGFLGLGPKLSDKTDAIIWSQLARSLSDLDRIYADQPGQPAFRAYVRRVLSPELARVGWDAAPGEDANISIMRASLLGALGQVGDPDVMAEARRRYMVFLAPSNDHALSASTRRTVLAIIAQHADQADWDQLHQLAKGARSELEREEFYSLLGRAEDPVLARRALDLALSGEPPPTVAPNVIDSVAVRFPGMALDFAAAHWPAISQLMEPDSRAQYAAALVGRGADPALIAKLDAFAESNIPANARGEVRRADAQIAYRARIRTGRLPDADHWLAGQGN
jgi:aminopeptidase N